jgi:hypothetical protein
MEGLIKWNWRALQAGSPLFDIAKEALEFRKRALLVKSLLEIYRKLCELFVFYLGGDIPGFNQPCASHKAR